MKGKVDGYEHSVYLPSASSECVLMFCGQLDSGSHGSWCWRRWLWEALQQLGESWIEHSQQQLYGAGV